MSKLTLDSLERSLSQATSVLRGRTEPQEARHYVFALLTLRALNDRFLDAREALRAELIAEGLEEDLVSEALEESERYGETHFIPVEARWSLSHGAEPGAAVEDLAPEQERTIAARLDEMLDLVEQASASRLEGVLTAHRFGSMPDDLLSELLAPLHRISLRAGDLAYEGLVGALADKLIERFSDEAGRKADCFTPAPVARLLVELLAPASEMSVYDPAAGVGLSLVEAARYAGRAHGGPPSLAGQEIDAGTLALCRMNLLLHGLSAEISRGDTLTAPGHLEDGALARFDRVLAHLPAPRDYKVKDLVLPERFPVMMPETGKRSDLLFVQHMLASLSSAERGDERDGWMAVVVPQSLLSKGGQERLARKRLVEEGLLEAVIALPSSGLAAQSAVLVLSNDGREERDQVLFIRADSAQELSPEEIERIVSVWESGESEPSVARLVSRAEIEASEGNLDPKSYVEIDSESEPCDVTAHLHGGIPAREIEPLSRWLSAYTGARERLFVEGKGKSHAAIADDLSSPEEIRSAIAALPAMESSQSAAVAAFDAWWEAASADIGALPATRDVYLLEEQLLESLTEAMDGKTPLQSHKIRGVLLRFFRERDSLLQTIAGSGFVAELIPKEEILASQRPELVRQLSEKATRISALEALFAEAREREEAPDVEEGDTETGEGKPREVLSPTEAKALKDRQKEVKSELGQILKFVKASVALVYGQSQRWGGSPPKEYTKGLSPSSPDFSGVEQLLDDVGDNPAVATQVEELKRMMGRGQGLIAENSALEGSLAAHKEREAELKQLKAEYREQESSVDRVIDEARASISPDDARRLALQRVRDELHDRLVSSLQSEQRSFADAVVAVAQRYAQPLYALEARRNERLRALSGTLDKLGYTL